MLLDLKDYRAWNIIIKNDFKISWYYLFVPFFESNKLGLLLILLSNWINFSLDLNFHDRNHILKKEWMMPINIKKTTLQNLTIFDIGLQLRTQISTIHSNIINCEIEFKNNIFFCFFIFFALRSLLLGLDEVLQSSN